MLELIDDWLHPLGKDESNAWYLASITVGRACDRLAEDTKGKRDRCRSVVMRRLNVSPNTFDIAKSDNSVYMQLVAQYVQAIDGSL